MHLSTLFTLAFCLLLPLQASQTPLPENPEGKRLGEFLLAMNSKEDALLRTFLQESYSAMPRRKIPFEERLARMKGLKENKAPFTVVDILDNRRDSITVLLKDREGEEVGLRLEVEAQEPHKVVEMRFGPPEALKESRPAKTYTQWKTLSELLEQVRADNGIPGMAIAVVQDGKIVDQAVVGVREQGKQGKAQLQDRWHIGSIGKAMTSTLLASLIEQGKLRWDSTLGELLPHFKMRPEYRGVTVTQLLQHRGGIPQDMRFTGPYVERITKGAKTPTEIRAAYLADVLQRAPVAKPGTRMAYSNAGYTLAGYLAEKVTGKPYEQLMQERVFQPLGMTHTKAGGVVEAGQPQGHSITPKGLEVFNFTGPLPIMTAPAGNITCSIGDLARFAASHLDGLRGKNRLLKAKTVQQLHTPPTVPPGEELYACGWEIMPLRKIHGHGGSNGTFRAHLAIFPEENLAIMAIGNAGGEDDPSPELQAIFSVQQHLKK